MYKQWLTEINLQNKKMCSVLHILRSWVTKSGGLSKSWCTADLVHHYPGYFNISQLPQKLGNPKAYYITGDPPSPPLKGRIRDFKISLR